MTVPAIKTDATVLDSLEASVEHLTREIAGMRNEVRMAYQLLRDMATAMQAGQPLPAPPVPLQATPAPVQATPAEDAPLVPLTELEVAATATTMLPHLQALRVVQNGGTLTLYLTLLALDHASLTPGAKPVTPETVRANILSRSPRFKPLRGVYDRAGKKNLLAEPSAREWLASEDPAAPGHTRYAQIMSGSLS